MVAGSLQDVRRPEGNGKGAPSAKVSTERKSKRILLIDDDNAIRTILSRALSLVGYEVADAGSGEEELTLFQMHPFDLVITDFKMPGMDGCTLSCRIKEKSANTPVVLITGSEKEDIRAWLREGFIDALMFKPFNFKDMQRRVVGLLSGSEEYSVRMHGEAQA